MLDIGATSSAELTVYILPVPDGEVELVNTKQVKHAVAFRHSMSDPIRVYEQKMYALWR